MKALLVDPADPTGFSLGEVNEPVAGPGQVLIEAHYASLNRSDLDDPRPGGVPGRDVAGIVLKSSRGGPDVGTRVLALAEGAFAAKVVADVESLAEVPDDVDLATAATLPVAGLAAMQALRAGLLDAPLKGARVLVTGASGAVGRFAVQLSAYGGAETVALVGDRGRADEISRLGADEIVTDLSDVDEPVDLVLETVGGATLVAAWGLLAANGVVQCIGASSGQPATFPSAALAGRARTLSSFLIAPPIAPDLQALVRLVADDSLQVHIAWRGPLSRVAEAADALKHRRLGGKAVLDLRSRAR